MNIEPNKVQCQECYWDGEVDDLLTAKNPFDSRYTISGCPLCKSVDCFVSLCDEPKCRDHVSCGTPTEHGYRSTCSKHSPFMKAQMEDS